MPDVPRDDVARGGPKSSPRKARKESKGPLALLLIRRRHQRCILLPLPPLLRSPVNEDARQSSNAARRDRCAGPVVAQANEDATADYSGHRQDEPTPQTGSGMAKP